MKKPPEVAPRKKPLCNSCTMSAEIMIWNSGSKGWESGS